MCVIITAVITLIQIIITTITGLIIQTTHTGIIITTTIIILTECITILIGLTDFTDSRLYTEMLLTEKAWIQITKSRLQVRLKTLIS